MFTKQNEFQAAIGSFLRRRWFFKECGVGLASVAAASLLSNDLRGSDRSLQPLAPKQPHFP
ncbi:MAG: sulfatase, partial [Planctomycetes bacterium]|nr:sulfatase [Planctomycetota bacterium]